MNFASFLYVSLAIIMIGIAFALFLTVHRRITTNDDRETVRNAITLGQLKSLSLLSSELGDRSDFDPGSNTTDWLGGCQGAEKALRDWFVVDKFSLSKRQQTALSDELVGLRSEMIEVERIIKILPTNTDELMKAEMEAALKCFRHSVDSRLEASRDIIESKMVELQKA